MQASKVYVNSHGLMVLCRVNANLSTAAVSKFFVRYPDGSETEWPAERVAADETGIRAFLAYTIQPGDLSMPGEYLLQPYVEYTPGFVGKGTPFRLRVWPRWR